MASSDIVYIKGLQVEAVIGVLAWERKIKQRLRLDIEMVTDVAPAAESDDLTKTLDYAAISNSVIAFAQAHQWQLIETFADKVAQYIMAAYSVDSLKVTVAKPAAVREAAEVGVIIKRERQADAG